LVPNPIAPLIPKHLRVDDPSIRDDLIVWRELDPLEAPADPQTLQRKIMSSVFRTEELSVRMSDKISKAQVVANAPGCELAEFTVGDARAENCIVMRDPDDPSHGLIYDKSRPGERPIPQKAARRLRDRAKLLAPP
jgi:hypothetical protein